MEKISKEVQELYKQYGLNNKTNFVPKNAINEGDLQRKLKSHFLEEYLGGDIFHGRQKDILSLRRYH